MDALEIAKEMVKSGHQREEILSNLRELGIENPEKYYEDAMRQEGKGIIKSEIGFGIDKEKTNDVLEGEAKSLFGESGNLFSGDKRQTSDEKRKVDSAMEDIPKLEITSIGSEGESVKDIGQMLGKEQKEMPFMKSMPTSSLGDLDKVERKLDDLISKLTAVYEIDRQILEANREVLLRLKTKQG